MSYLDIDPNASLAETATVVADWLSILQNIYHAMTHPGPKPLDHLLTRDTCDAGLCGDYRTFRDGLRAAIAREAA